MARPGAGPSRASPRSRSGFEPTAVYADVHLSREVSANGIHAGKVHETGPSEARGRPHSFPTERAISEPYFQLEDVALQPAESLRTFLAGASGFRVLGFRFAVERFGDQLIGARKKWSPPSGGRW